MLSLNIVYLKKLGVVTFKFYGVWGNFEIDGVSIYYSGDAYTIDSSVLQRLKHDEIDYFYQDVTRYENNAHMNVRTLVSLIPENLRDRVICMHFDDEQTIDEVAALGFGIARGEQ